MKRIYLIIFIFSLVFISSCSDSPRSKMEEILLFSGENRKELEFVLDHYSKNKSDSLKLKAAEFLILNMRYHKSRFYEQEDMKGVYSLVEEADSLFYS